MKIERSSGILEFNQYLEYFDEISSHEISQESYTLNGDEGDLINGCFTSGANVFIYKIVVINPNDAGTN